MKKSTQEQVIQMLKEEIDLLRQQTGSQKQVINSLEEQNSLIRERNRMIAQSSQKMAETSDSVIEQNRILREQLKTAQNLFDRTTNIINHQKTVELDLLKTKYNLHSMMIKVMFILKGLDILQRTLQIRKFLQNDFMKIDMDSVQQTETASVAQIGKISPEIQRLENSISN